MNPMIPDANAAGRFRRTALRVLAVQGLALLVLWWLQAHYTR